MGHELPTHVKSPKINQKAEPEVDLIRMLYLSYLFSEKFPLLGFEPQTAAVWVHEADDKQIVVTLLPVL